VSDPTPRLTHAEKRARRREAALKGAATRKARIATPPPEPLSAAPSARDLIDRARSMGREADLYYHAHLARWPHRPADWTEAQRLALGAFLDRFIRPDGTPQPVRTRGAKR
jgi:hypothetical protein